MTLESHPVGRITAAGVYDSLLDVDLLRSALNFRSDHPTDANLQHRIGEASQVIEGRTRLVLPVQTWEYTYDQEYFYYGNYYGGYYGQTGYLKDSLRYLEIPGLFRPGSTPVVAVTDSNGDSVNVKSTILGIGTELRIEPLSETDPAFHSLDLPMKISVQRGVSSGDLPADLRAAIITQVEMLVEGFSPMAENSIRRICYRYGWAG